LNHKFEYQFVALTFFIGLIGLISNPVSAAESVVSLKDMVEKVVSTNPEVQARYHTFLGAGFEQEAFRGGFLPKADIVSTYRNQEQTINSIGNTNIPRMNNELVLRQMLFDGFATSYEVKRLGHAQRVRYYELQAAMQDTTLEFMRAYIDTARFRTLAQYAKDNYIVHKQLFDRIKDRVDAGVARKVDLEQASGRLALAESNLLIETTNLHDVSARIQRLYGELPPATLEAPTFFSAGVEPTATEALKVAYRQNPNLLSTIEDIQASKDEIRAREGRFSPRLDLQARKNLGSSSDGRDSTNAADVLELTMNFNLFNGFSDQNVVRQTAQKLNGAHDARDKSCVDTRQIVVIAYNDIKQLQEQIIYRNQHKSAIENAREAYRKQFDIGQRTLLDLLDTENEYFQAKRSLATAEYDLQAAYARTYAGQGELLNKIGVRRGNLPEYAREEYMDSENVCEVVAPAPVTFDKAALLADAKPLSFTYPSLTKPIAPTVTIPSQQVLATCNATEISGKVDDWANAWRKKDIENYLKFYSAGFVPEQPLDRASWEKQRRKRLSTNSKIGLKVENLTVDCQGNKAVAKFRQYYDLTNFKIKKTGNTSCEVCNMERLPVKVYSEQTSKELQFERVNNQWQIIRELTNK
jgi:adhesin transport system outer membrane protein